MAHDHELEEAQRPTGKELSRRAAIRLGGRAAVTTAAGGLLIAAGGPAALAAAKAGAAPAGRVRPAGGRGATFQGTEDWTGTYAGVLDGRPATLDIRAGMPYAGDTDSWGFSITLTDFSGVQYWTHSDFISNVGPQCHELPGFSLATDDYSGYATFNRLLLHTWDTSYVSGETSWNGSEYGCMFRIGGLS
ncbi:MAG TPA: hypothetical protein VFN97_01635 [Actinospica sp.]|nr:hypothetical protein [Actinospica sp.]